MASLANHPDAYRLFKAPSAAERLQIEGLIGLALSAIDEMVTVPCAACRAMSRYPASSAGLPCSACGAALVFRRCATCGSVCQIPTKGPRAGWRCEFCGKQTKSGSVIPDATASDRRDELTQRGLIDAPSDVVFVGGFEVVGGSGGIDLRPGVMVSLWTPPDALHIRIEIGVPKVITVPYDQIAALEISGTVSKTGGGFIGGGFGLVAAVEGMVVSSFLNALTSGIAVDTRMRVATNDGELLLRHDAIPHEAVRAVLSPLWTRFEAAQRAGTAASPQPDESAVALLAQLGQLHDAGVLTDEEFVAKKADLLGRM